MKREQKFYDGVEKWLTGQAVLADKASRIVERIGLFGVPLLNEQLGRPARIGVTGKADKYGVHIYGSISFGLKHLVWIQN